MESLPLTKAVVHDQANRLKALIRQGEDVHAGDDEALYAAVFMSKTDMAKTLLVYGANACAREGEFVLIAARKCNHRLVNILLSHMGKRQVKEARSQLILLENVQKDPVLYGFPAERYEQVTIFDLVKPAI